MSGDAGGHRAVPAKSSQPAPVVVVLGVVLVLGLLASGTALAFAGWKPEGIIGLLSGLGTVAAGLLVALGKLASLGDRVAEVDHKVEQVKDQTNGDLERTVGVQVRKEVRSALADHGLPARAVGERTQPLQAPRRPKRPHE